MTHKLKASTVSAIRTALHSEMGSMDMWCATTEEEQRRKERRQAKFLRAMMDFQLYCREHYR